MPPGTSVSTNSFSPLTKLIFHILPLQKIKIIKKALLSDIIIIIIIISFMEMTGNDAGLNGLVKHKEISFTESPKGESSEWTDEKHCLYLKSMEASFVDKLYNSLDMQCWQTQNECSSDSMTSRKIHANTGCPSGQFKVLRNGFWSRVDFRRENLKRNGTNSPNVSSSNPWIQHFRNGNRHAPIESHSPQEKLLLTICSNTEVTDQNFDDEDSAIQLMSIACNKKRKGIYAVSESGNDQVQSRVTLKKELLLPLGTSVTKIMDDPISKASLRFLAV